MVLPVTADEETRQFLVALGDEVSRAEPNEDLRDLMRRVQIDLQADRSVMVRLLDSLMQSDAVLSPVATTLDTWIRSAIAASIAADVLAGEPRVFDEPDELDDLWRVHRVRGEARHAVLVDLDMLSSSGVARVLGSAATNREAARALRERGDAVGLPHKNGYVYPAFQFDIDRHQVWPVVARVNRLLDARHDPWGVAGWWIARQSAADAPRWQLVADPQRAADLLDSAEALLEPIG